MATKNSQTRSDYLMGDFENLWHFGRTMLQAPAAATQASRSWAATSGTSCGPCCNITTTTSSSNCLVMQDEVERDQSSSTGAASPSIKSNRIQSAHNNWQQQLQPLFRVLDEDEDGQISLDGMHLFLRKLGKEQVSRACLVSRIESVRPNCGGRRGRDAVPLLALDFSQFTALYESLLGGAESQWQGPEAEEEDDELLDAFHMYDRNRDGFISASELAAVLVGLLAAPAGRHGMGMAGHVSRCQALIDRVDSDGNGLVDLQEFKAMLMMGPSTSSHEQQHIPTLCKT